MSNSVRHLTAVEFTFDLVAPFDAEKFYKALAELGLEDTGIRWDSLRAASNLWGLKALMEMDGQLSVDYIAGLESQLADALLSAGMKIQWPAE